MDDVRACAALTWREIIRLIRQPARVAAAIGTPAVIWIMLAAGFAGSMSLGDDIGGYAGYLAPGMASLVVMLSAIFAAMSLIEDADSGFLQSALTSPAPRWTIIGAKVMGGGLIGWVQAVLLLPATVLLGLPVTPSGLMSAMAALFLMSVGLTGLSLAFAWRMGSAQAFHGVMNIILMPMWILSGSVMPLAGASDWLATIMLVNPLTWPTSAVRIGITGQAGDGQLVGAVWALTIAFAVGGLTAAFVSMRSRRRNV